LKKIRKAKEQKILLENAKKQKEKQQREEKKQKILLEEDRKQKEEHKHENYQDLISNIDKDRDKIITDQEFHKPKIKKEEDCYILSFKGKEFLLCEKGHEFFEDGFVNDKYYDLVINDGYLGRKHKEEGYIQYFHRELVREKIEELAKKNLYSFDDIEVHHIDLTRTNDKVENLKPLFHLDHKRLHFRLKFDGTDEEFETWYENKHQD
jgi:hypothetical protein